MIKSNKTKLFAALLILGSLVAGSGAYIAQGSSHREAPLISADPKADATDVFAFVSPDNSDTVTLIADYLPFQEPAGGPNFYNFDDNVLYEIKVDNNGDAVEDITYQFEFNTQTQNPNTFLYSTGQIDSLTDPDYNVRQTYTLTKVEAGQSTRIASNVPVPPANIGPKSTPNYAGLQSSAIRQADGIKMFAGQSDDPFFVELGGLFDLLTIRKLPGNAGGGVDGLRGYNVNSLALQIPISQLTKNKDKPADAKNPDAVIGVWTTASRQSTRVLSAGDQNENGSYVQVSRLGAPLVNEVVVPLGAKDIWNGSKPIDDAQFANGVTDPELGRLLKGLYNINVPPQGPFGSAEQRDDLIAIFLTGIPDLTKPANVVPSEQLRLNVSVPVSSNPNRLGVLGGDFQGFPNGRRLADDVTDIEIRAVAGAAYPLFHPDFTPDATGVQLGDGVDANENGFRSSFPYLALPNSGFDSRPHNTTGTENGGVTGPATPSMDNTQPAAGTAFLYRLYNAKANNHFYTTSMAERDAAVNGGYSSEGRLGIVATAEDATHVPLYRLYSARLNNHFYTANAAERDSAVRNGFKLEGVIGYVYANQEAAAGTTVLPVQRLYTRDGDHFYTTNVSEKESLVRAGYGYEGVAWFIKP